MNAELPNAAPLPPPLSCDEALRQIECLIEEGSLKNTERALLMAHLDGCPGCRGNLERRRQLDARLRESFAGLDTRSDFTERLMALIPKREGGISSAWRRPSVRASGARSVTPDGKRGEGRALLVGRTWALPLAAALLLLVAGAWWLLRSPQSTVHVLTVASSTKAMVLKREGKERALVEGMELRKDDVLTATDTGSCELTVDGQPFCSIRLTADAQLSVLSRGRYNLRQGEAYFDVNPERSRAKDEHFDVETAFGGHVIVVGTCFGIIVPSTQASAVTVVVDRGQVRVRPLTGQERMLSEGQECDLLRDGSTSVPLPIAAGRLARLRPEEWATAHLPPPPANVPEPKSSGGNATSHVDWSRTVADLDFRGRTLRDALLRLQERMGAASEWPVLAAQAGKLAPEGTSSLILRRDVSAAVAVRWLAREQGLRFAEPMTLRPAAADEGLGEAQSGEPPAPLAAQLDTEVLVSNGEMPTDKALELLAQQTSFTVLVSPQTVLPRTLKGRTWYAMLEQLALSGNADWAFYDQILYVAPRRKIEALTAVGRSDALDRWLGSRPLPAWERSLKRILSGLTLDREGRLNLSSVEPLLSGVALYPDERGVRYATGVRGVRTVELLRRLLQEGSAPAPDPTAVLNEGEAAGMYRDLGELLEPANRRVPVVYQGERREFPKQAFVVRRMPLGRALECAAWLHGLGLRMEPGRIVVDQRGACYGAPTLQVVSLAAAAQRCPRLAPQLSEVLARQAQACWPDLLRGVEWLPMREALAFCGDSRQLAAVQGVAREMEQALRSPPDVFDLQAWQPQWRTEVEKNLAEPFRGDGSGTLPAGRFVGLLRQSGLFISLRPEILVDPTAMKELADHQLPALEVRGQTLGQALNTLVRAAGLRMIIEEGVIWLKP